MIIFHFSFLHFSFATVRLHGRPKWTRTTLINLSLALLEKSRLRFIKGSVSDLVLLVGPSGLEPPTSCLSGTRSNLLSYEPMWLVWIFLHTWFSSWGSAFSHSLASVSIGLSSRTVARKVFSPLQSLTSVFGMGTGGPSAFRALTFFSFQGFLIPEN